MSHTVFANSMGFSHKGSGDKSISTAPDVCKTPVGSSTPPIPYTVTSQVATLKEGSSSVLISGQPTALARSNHSRCMGDQPGSAKGIISGATGDKTEFVSYSFDVKVEGEGVVRHLDATTMNNANTAGINMGMASTPTKIDVEDKTLDDPYRLRFEALDKLGQPVKGIPYALTPAGQKADGLEPSGQTNAFGYSEVASTVQNEQVDFHVLWKTVKVKD